MTEARYRRASATPEELAIRFGNPAKTYQRDTVDDEEILDERPNRLPNSSRRYNLPATEREYIIPLTNGTALYVTEQKLVTMRRDYQEAAQEVTPGTIAQKQHRKPHPTVNRAAPPDVIEVPPRTTQAEPADYLIIGQRLRVFAKRMLLVCILLLLIMLIGYVLFNVLAAWWQVHQDDVNYGRPRTYQTDYNVGHGTAQNPLSHFIALNLNRHIEVIEIPGDDPSKSLTYIGPTLIGAGEELAVVTLSFEDVDGDGHPDLVIHVGDSRFIFLNTKVNGVWKFVPAPNQQ